MRRHTRVPAVILAAAIFALLASLVSPAAAGPTRAAATGTVTVSFAIDKFVKQGNGLAATGRAIATYSDTNGQQQSTTQTFKVKVIAHGIRGLASAATTCPVLFLQLDKLSLTLLGLNVNLDKVVLTINADSKGGALGSLFCSLAHAKVKVRTLAEAARQLTAVARQSGLTNFGSGLGFAVPLVSQVAAATGPCSVLDLVLGPLNLKLLGLLVNLNQVHLTITADPTGGALGSLFCALANAKVGP